MPHLFYESAGNIAHQINEVAYCLALINGFTYMLATITGDSLESVCNFQSTTTVTSCSIGATCLHIKKS